MNIKYIILFLILILHSNLLNSATTKDSKTKVTKKEPVWNANGNIGAIVSNKTGGPDDIFKYAVGLNYKVPDLFLFGLSIYGSRSPQLGAFYIGGKIEIDPEVNIIGAIGVLYACNGISTGNNSTSGGAFSNLFISSPLTGSVYSEGPDGIIGATSSINFSDSMSIAFSFGGSSHNDNVFWRDMNIASAFQFKFLDTNSGRMEDYYDTENVTFDIATSLSYIPFNSKKSVAAKGIIQKDYYKNKIDRDQSVEGDISCIQNYAKYAFVSKTALNSPSLAKGIDKCKNINYIKKHLGKVIDPNAEEIDEDTIDTLSNEDKAKVFTYMHDTNSVEQYLYTLQSANERSGVFASNEHKENYNFFNRDVAMSEYARVKDLGYNSDSDKLKNPMLLMHYMTYNLDAMMSFSIFQLKFSNAVSAGFMYDEYYNSSSKKYSRKNLKPFTADGYNHVFVRNIAKAAALTSAKAMPDGLDFSSLNTETVTLLDESNNSISSNLDLKYGSTFEMVANLYSNDYISFGLASRIGYLFEKFAHLKYFKSKHKSRVDVSLPILLGNNKLSFIPYVKCDIFNLAYGLKEDSMAKIQFDGGGTKDPTITETSYNDIAQNSSNYKSYYLGNEYEFGFKLTVNF